MLLIAIFIGLIVGGAAGYFLFENEDFVMFNCILGVAGAVTGTVGYLLLTHELFNGSLVNFPAIIISILGAILFVVLFNMLHKLVESKITTKTPGDEL
ncbi:MAG: hypothetical protein QFB86_04705 [Patescibacteria group bacterium]|nr:hypothetical protein [Patescibacteria group bacterium]